MDEIFDNQTDGQSRKWLQEPSQVQSTEPDSTVIDNKLVRNDRNDDQGDCSSSIPVAAELQPDTVNDDFVMNPTNSLHNSNRLGESHNIDDSLLNTFDDFEWLVYNGGDRRYQHSSGDIENDLDDTSDSNSFYDGVMEEYEALIGLYGNCWDGGFGILSESEIIDIKNDIFDKPRPKHTWNPVPNLYYRELGLTGRNKKFIAGPNSSMFQYRLSGSLYVIERMQLMPKISEFLTFEAYSLNFNKTGSVLVFGSDDLKITLWEWSTNKILYAYDSPHNSRGFATKFFESQNSLNVISTANSGVVYSARIPPNGGKPFITTLVEHADKVHDFILPPTSPHEMLTVGQDARVYRYDFRENVPEMVIAVKDKGKHIPLYTMAAHPIDQEFCIGGGDEFVRVYDRRNLSKPIIKLAPKHLLAQLPYTPCITSVIYNFIGDEILAAYNSNEIFLFDNNPDVIGNYLHKYKGNSNYFPLKVNFFGPRSEYVMSGSNCGNCFFWDKTTEAIVQWMPGIGIGSIKCPEPHPSFPILATSSEESIQIWGPSHEYPPNLNDLRKCVDKNLRENQCHNYSYFNYSPPSD